MLCHYNYTTAPPNPGFRVEPTMLTFEHTTPPEPFFSAAPWGGDILQARAVGCAFLMTEARGAVGRLFRDLHGGRGRKLCSRSLRDALLDPRLPKHGHSHHDRVQNPTDAPPPPGATPSAQREKGAPISPRFQHNSTNARDSVLSGLLSSSEYVRQRTNGDGGLAAAAAAASRRNTQFHACFQALHAFSQEHGHLPVALDREQADEVVSVADELVKTGQKVRVGGERDLWALSPGQEVPRSFLWPFLRTTRFFSIRSAARNKPREHATIFVVGR